MKLVWRYLSWWVLAGLGLQLFFFARIATMNVINPESTAFMRSEIARVSIKAITGEKPWRWSQEWVQANAISNPNCHINTDSNTYSDLNTNQLCALGNRCRFQNFK